MRRPLVALITFVAGLFFLVEFLLPEKAPRWLGGFENPLTPWVGPATNLLIVVGAMAILLGPLNLVRSHAATVRRRQKGWIESLAFLAFLVVGILVASLKVPEPRNLFQAVHDVLFDGALRAFGSTSMALLSFYLISAAYRAFRLSSVDAGVMMAAATVVLLGQVPLGDWLTGALPHALQARAWAQWLLMGPNAAVQRAVILGACGGAFATAIRHWLSLGTRET